jgi:branched-chain amino acid transport system substrate-binding protein
MAKVEKDGVGSRPTVMGRRRSRRLLSFDFCLLTFDFSLLPFPFCHLIFALFFSLNLPASSFAQDTKPYASIDRDAVNYSGPGRDASHDLAGPEIRIGLLLPLTGRRQAEGEALQHAAQMAVDEENATSLPAHRLTLVTRDESGPWGQASGQVVNLVFDDQAVALITSGEGGPAHLAEQVGNKVGVPILTLSSDATTTEINLPWIFRLGPTDTMQAQAFARDIYQHKKLQKVLLLSQNDRDGRMGSEAFLNAAAALHAEAPTAIVVDPEKITEALAGQVLANSQAVVIWADAPTTSLFIAYLKKLQPQVPVYLCRKGAEDDPSVSSHITCSDCGGKNAPRWIAAARENPQARADFDQQYLARFGIEPGMGAAEAYDSVRIIAASLRQAGPNRVRLRDALAAVSAYSGASGIIAFDHAGNDTSEVTLLELK